MDEQSAFVMMCYLVEKWLLPDIYVGDKDGNSLNGIFIECAVIASMLELVVEGFTD